MAYRVNLLFLLSFPLFSEGSNILLVPSPSISHVNNMALIGGPLVDRGHKIYAVMNANCHKGNKIMLDAKVELLLYPHRDNSCVVESPPQEVKDSMIEMVMQKRQIWSIYTMMQYQSHVLYSEGQALYSDPRLIERIRKLHIDLVIVDGTPLSLYYYILPYKLDLPYISLVQFYHSQWIGGDDLPSFSPVMIGTNTDKMSFLQRVENIIKHFAIPFFCSIFQGSRDSLIRQYAPEKPDSSTMTMLELQRRSKLWLMQIDTLMDYPRSLLPHVVYVGGLSASPARSLQPSLAHIADSAHSGLIIVSFGSVLSSMPKSVTDMMLEAFRQLTEVTIIWKYNGPPMEDLPDHIHILPWLPQNDLLGHPNTRAFVTHSGINSQYEALYHGVPMVGIPVYGDQPYNAARMQAKGYGLFMALADLTAEDLYEMLRKVIHDPKYQTTIKYASKIYHSRKLSAKEQAVYSVERVMKYGGDHVISSDLNQPWYQYWMLDVLLFLLAALIALSVCLGYTVRCFLQCCYPDRSKIKIS